MNILACQAEILDIFKIIRFAIKLICFIIPVLLIVFGVMDLSKAVTAQDEKATKEAQKRFLSRCIYAVVIFLVPTIITALFNILPDVGNIKTNSIEGASWNECWTEAA